MAIIFHSAPQTVETMLDGKTRFIIPKYQRAYSWVGTQVDELWNDLIDNYKNDPGHFYVLGPIVTVKQPGVNSPTEVVDGQQRLVTLTLLLCALRNSLAKHKPVDARDQNNYSDLIGEISKSIVTDGKPLIELNNVGDDDVFASICTEAGIPKQNVVYNKQIIDNYDILLNYTNRLCESHFYTKAPWDAIRDIGKLLVSIKKNTYFVYVEISNEDYSYQVFQSLNSKGQKLSQSDLIKSLLLNISKNDSDNIEDSWNKIMRSSTIKKNPDDFLYYSMLSRTCPKLQDGSDEILKMKLYSIVKKNCEEPPDVKKYLQDLEEDLHIIKILNKPNMIRLQDNYDHDFIHLFYGLKQINAKYFRRPIIAACREWGLSDKTKSLIDCLLKFFFMYRTISKLDIDQIKRIARNVTCQILDERNLDEILYTILKSDRLGSTIDNIDQERFMDEFEKSINDLSNPVATYILYSLEKKLGDFQDIRVDFKYYNIEHIFPNNPNNDWSNKDELQAHKNRLGNLTLLDTKWNASIQNRSFEDKMNKGERCYSKSGLALNKKHLTEYKQWGVKEIEDREKKLIEHAKEIWDLSEYSKLAKKPQN